jgi:hypothetical protein
MAAGFKTGGRKPGSKNAKTIERERLQAEAAAELSKSGLDSSAANILRGVMNDPRVALHSRLDAAKALVREERGDDGVDQTYVVNMPAPVTSLSEWFHLHDPDNQAFLQSGTFKKDLAEFKNAQKPADNTPDTPPWIDDQKDEPNV